MCLKGRVLLIALIAATVGVLFGFNTSGIFGASPSLSKTGNLATGISENTGDIAALSLALISNES